MGKRIDIKIMRLTAAAAIASSLFLGGCRLETESEAGVQEASDGAGAPREVEKTTGAVTLEMYNRLGKGMSYEEVKAIIGTEGKLMTEEGDSDATYVWEGEGNGFLSVSFRKDKLLTRTHFGLK
jgi:hypothetical protein